MSRHRSPRGGFTLVELLAALALAAVLLLGAVAMLRQLGDESHRIAVHKEERDASENGARVLRLALRRVETSSDSSQRFAGDERGASFQSWCDTPGGWLELCRVEVRVTPRGNGAAIEAKLAGAPWLLLWSSGDVAELRYFGGGAEPWVRVWANSIVAPGALGIVSPADTVVLLAGSGS